MADREVVIKIPEELYETLKNPEILSTMYHASRAADAVRSGTPLPKGHGRLIDASELLTTSDIRSDGSEFNYVSSSIIDNAPTIIEADSESKIGQWINNKPVTPKGVTITDFEWIGEKAYPICPKCNCNIIEEYISCADYAEMYKPMKFCPNCGVKMGRSDKE